MMMKLKDMVDEMLGSSDLGNTLIILPTPELMPDFLDKLGIDCSKLSKLEIVNRANNLNIFSTISLRNKIANGADFSHITDVIEDEAHHDDADTYEFIRVGLPDDIRVWGWTASPFCGTPQRTHKFRKKWHFIVSAITLDRALELGVITYPNVIVEPLVNDDVMELKGGEFVISQVESEFENKIEHALAITRDKLNWWKVNQVKGTLTPHKTTLIGVPSSRVFEPLKEYADKFNMKMEYITANTTAEQRKRIYKLFRERKCALVHINVISEGKDLPVRNYLDMAPCMSPRLFFQRFGRATRPLGEHDTLADLGDYLCTNRNIERHCYLFDGTLPYDQVKKALLAFPEESTRSGVRAFGIESLGRIKPTYVKLLTGLTVAVYNISQVMNGKKECFLCLLHPLKGDSYWFRQEAGLVKEGELQRLAYSRWSYISAPTELKGYRSSQPNVLTERQHNMWKQHAKAKGLDPDQKVDAKKFSLLPVLINSGVSL